MKYLVHATWTIEQVQSIVVELEANDEYEARQQVLHTYQPDWVNTREWYTTEGIHVDSIEEFSK